MGYEPNGTETNDVHWIIPISLSKYRMNGRHIEAYVVMKFHADNEDEVMEEHTYTYIAAR